MKSTFTKVLVVSVAVVAIFLTVRRCGDLKGCGKASTETTSDTTTTEVVHPVRTDTPPPIIAVPTVDSSIFARKEYYKKMYQQQKAAMERMEKYLSAVQGKLQDTTLDLESRYAILLAGFEAQRRECAEMTATAAELNRKLEEAANGIYFTEGIDSTSDYRLEWGITSFGPLYPDGFSRQITTYNKTVTNTVTKYRRPFSVAALYGFSPDGTKIYSGQIGKDFGRLGIISQFGYNSEKNIVLSGGLKWNL